MAACGIAFCHAVVLLLAFFFHDTELVCQFTEHFVLLRLHVIRDRAQPQAAHWLRVQEIEVGLVQETAHRLLAGEHSFADVAVCVAPNRAEICGVVGGRALPRCQGVDGAWVRLFLLLHLFGFLLHPLELRALVEVLLGVLLALGERTLAVDAV